MLAFRLTIPVERRESSVVLIRKDQALRRIVTVEPLEALPDPPRRLVSQNQG